MKPNFHTVPQQVIDEEEGNGPVNLNQNRRRLELPPGRWFFLNYNGADEPDDEVLLISIAGRIFRFTRCESVQLIFLILCVALMLFTICGAIFEVNTPQTAHK